MNSKKSELYILLDKAINMLNERLSKAPDWQVLKMIKAQLEAIQSDVNGKGSLDNEQIKNINIGILAVREFEADDPEFADILIKIDYLFSEYNKFY